MARDYIPQLRVGLWNGVVQLENVELRLEVRALTQKEPFRLKAHSK
jgi:hypothetical protein